ncbi:MAG: hypothetical protein DMF72_12545, partial [Acidobacteria bacterium]
DTDTRAIQLDVDTIDWIGNRRATVSASCINDPEGVSYLYTLRLKNRKWIVTYARMVGGS